MAKWFKKSLMVPTMVSLFSLAMIPTMNVTYAQSTGPVQVKGTAAIAASHGTLQGHKNPNDKISLTIGLQLNHADQLNSFIADLYNPSSPNYKHFLTPAQFKSQFGPAQSTVDSVTNFLQGKGLTVNKVSDNNAFITVSGTVSQVENAFGVTINNYKNSQGQTYFANANAPQVPSELANVVTNVLGLDNEAHYSHPQIKSAATPKTGSGPAGGYTPSELRSAYDINPLISSGIDGTGQTVAVMELDGYVASNVTTYDNNYSLGSPAPQNVYVDGYNGSAGSGEVEVELDIEDINAIAPKAQVMVYEGPNTDQGLIDVYQTIANDNKAQVTSVSWGACEQNMATATINSLHTIYQQFAAQGQSIYAASGDNGAYDCQYNFTTLAVDSPADDPYVTGVGGTTLNLSSTGGYGSESVWGSSILTGGGGGGLSTIYAMPSWQSGPGVQNSYSNGKREVPDVSADADPNTGYSIYSQGKWQEVGGTSAAAPLWSGITALNNQYAATKGKGNMGQANPTLYKMFNTAQTYSAFHDITTGKNLYYPATAGYDMASGIGTPDAYNLIRDING